MMNRVRADRAIEPRWGRAGAHTLVVAVTLLAWAGWVSVGRAEEDTALLELPITPTEQQHWAWRPLKRPALPQVQDAWREWARNPVDLYIAEELAAEGFTPPTTAPARVLLRRVALDLTGLPPDTDLEGMRADGYERMVDQLLADPAYGERWAQHWLDLARFAETDGFEHDRIRPDAWKYRDWVIASLNEDLPYDRFVQLQIAGDRLRPGDRQAAVATAFCLSGPDMPDINSQAERRHVLLNEITSTVGSVFLGLQVGCAQCHDHKFEPISQADFYRLRAFFEPTLELKRDQQITVLADRLPQPVVSRLMVRGDWRRPGPEVQPAVPRIARTTTADTPGATTLRGQGVEAEVDQPSHRVDLAHWLTRDDNGLVARVIVNRLWQYHFGQGLAPSSSDVGLMSPNPSHPDLLDWLAAELIAADWSLKHVQRLIVTSATFRQTSVPDTTRSERGRQRDPQNELLWRFPRRRLAGEVIRDQMLAASDSLNRRQGGPGVRPPLPEALRATLLRGQWEVTPNEQDHFRRSIYVFARRNLRFPTFDVFDRPDANASCPRRGTSTTAIQSLYLLNSPFALDCARRVAGAIARESDLRETQVERAYQRVLGRGPSSHERARAVEFIKQQGAWLQREGRDTSQLATLLPPRPATENSSPSPHEDAALVDFCLALLNSSEFIFIE